MYTTTAKLLHRETRWNIYSSVAGTTLGDGVAPVKYAFYEKRLEENEGNPLVYCSTQLLTRV